MTREQKLQALGENFLRMKVHQRRELRFRRILLRNVLSGEFETCEKAIGRASEEMDKLPFDIEFDLELAKL